MKFLGWMILLSLNTVFAQEVIESTPLSVEDNGARPLLENGTKPIVVEESKEIIKIETVELKPESLESVEIATKKEIKKSSKGVAKKVKEVESPVVITSEKIDPIDGQLKLEDKKTEQVAEVKVEESKIIEAPVKSETPPVILHNPDLKKYLQFSYGYLNSRYEKIHPSLDNGSSVTSVAFVADMTHKVQLGFSMEILTDTSAQEIPDNIRSVQYRLFANYHAQVLGFKAVHWVSGLALAVGDYGVRRRYIALSGDEASVKLYNGTIVGLVPAVGIRIYLVGRNSFDAMVEYHQYFGKPQSYIGGLAIAPRFSFEF